MEVPPLAILPQGLHWSIPEAVEGVAQVEGGRLVEDRMRMK